MFNQRGVLCGAFVAVLVAQGQVAARSPQEATAQAVPTSPGASDAIDIRGIWTDKGFDKKKAAARGVDVAEMEPPKMTHGAHLDVSALLKSDDRGTVLLECRIETDGVPKACKIIRHVGLVLDREALRSVQEWRFVPLKLRGEPSVALANLTVSFEVRNEPVH